MGEKSRIPWFGMALAGLITTVLALAGIDSTAVVATGTIWLLSLWVDRLRPPPEPDIRTIADRPDLDAIARNAMQNALEATSLPLVLMDQNRIIGANLAARTSLGAHILGQDARIAMRHPDAVRLLSMPDGGSVTIRGLTGAGSLWQLTRQSIDSRYWAIELRDRTAEADISRAHTDFVANASHELRTPLSSIIGYVETLAEDPAKIPPEMTRRFLGTVLREARRMEGLVSDLMSLSQLEAEKHDQPTDHIEISQLAARVVGEFAPAPGQEASRVILARPDAPFTITGDAKQLEQLLRNLIDNALKYGDDDKPVHVGIEAAARNMVELKVRDHGPGIAPEHLPHLTRRFYRTDPGRSRAAGGTGLGLAIVKHIVERHRGKLDITSQLGEGTQVCVKLPINEAA